MKKVLIGIFLILLLFSGCAKNEDVAGQTTESVTTNETVAKLWLEGSQVEQQTNGAVRRYDIGGKTYHTICAIGDRLLLIEKGEKAQLTVLSGEEGILVASAALNVNLSADNTGYQALQNGFVYYQADTNQAVFLDLQLQTKDAVSLPKDLEGTPVFSADGDTAYYCVGQEIRAFDMERKLRRLVKSHSCEKQTLLGCYLDEKLLSCRVEDSAGNTQTLWVSGQTGQTLSTDQGIKNIWTYADNYFLTRVDGIVEQRIFGEEGKDPKELAVSDGTVVSALELGGVLQWKQSKEGKLKLSFYTLKSGKKTSAVTLEEVGEPKAFLADRWNQCVWILTQTDTGDSLLRWDIDATPKKGKTKYTSALRTKDAPDESGLEVCQERVDKLNKKHGVFIRIWEYAAKYPRGYDLEAEYRVEAFQKSLDRVEAVLDSLPEDFLYKSVRSVIRICLVRSIDGEVAAEQCWFDKDAFIVLSVGADIENEMLKAIGSIIDVHVLSNSPRYDYWYKTNPEGFVYGDTATYSDTYLEDDTRAFADRESMESAPVDRSRIFWQAMQPENAQMFQTDVMQAKLKAICKGIREAWHWEDEMQVFPWEQYLSKPLAPKK